MQYDDTRYKYINTKYKSITEYNSCRMESGIFFFTDGYILNAYPL